jgi:hypothetical protein
LPLEVVATVPAVDGALGAQAANATVPRPAATSRSADRRLSLIVSSSFDIERTFPSHG